MLVVEEVAVELYRSIRAVAVRKAVEGVLHREAVGARSHLHHCHSNHHKYSVATWLLLLVALLLHQATRVATTNSWCLVEGESTVALVDLCRAVAKRRHRFQGVGAEAKCPHQV